MTDPTLSALVCALTVAAVVVLVPLIAILGVCAVMRPNHLRECVKGLTQRSFDP